MTKTYISRLRDPTSDRWPNSRIYGNHTSAEIWRLSHDISCISGFFSKILNHADLWQRRRRPAQLPGVHRHDEGPRAPRPQELQPPGGVDGLQEVRQAGGQVGFVLLVTGRRKSQVCWKMGWRGCVNSAPGFTQPSTHSLALYAKFSAIWSSHLPICTIHSKIDQSCW